MTFFYQSCGMTSISNDFKDAEAKNDPEIEH